MNCVCKRIVSVNVNLILCNMFCQVYQVKSKQEISDLTESKAALQKELEEMKNAFLQSDKEHAQIRFVA